MLILLPCLTIGTAALFISAFFNDALYFVHIAAGQSEMDFELTISCAEPRKIEHTLLCYVQHLETPLTMHVSAEVKVRDLLESQFIPMNGSVITVELYDRIVKLR